LVVTKSITIINIFFGSVVVYCCLLKKSRGEPGHGRYAPSSLIANLFFQQTISTFNLL